jgi:hypothetical protein
MNRSIGLSGELHPFRIHTQDKTLRENSDIDITIESSIADQGSLGLNSGCVHVLHPEHCGACITVLSDARCSVEGMYDIRKGIAVDREGLRMIVQRNNGLTDRPIG